MQYPPSFFNLQWAFANRVAARFSIPLADALARYTVVATLLQLDDRWEVFARELASAQDPVNLIYQTYCERAGDEQLPQPGDPRFRDWPLFGCFYYAVLETDTIRTHFINNDLPGMRPLGSERQHARRAELRRMFLHIRENVPQVTTVAGHSWLYNLPAYTRLFPPSYTKVKIENPDGVLDQMVLWFQCYDRHWNINPTVADELLRRVDEVAGPDDLRLCFPYQRFRTKAPIADFYAFYDIPV